MLCKVINNKRGWVLVMLAGAVSAAFGITGISMEPDATGNIAMLLGMFTGLGTVLFLFSLIRVLYLHLAPASKLKAEEINRKDERNIQVSRAAAMAAFVAATLLCAVMAFVFVWLGYRVPAYIAVGAIWVQVIVFLIAQKTYESKM